MEQAKICARTKIFRAEVLKSRKNILTVLRFYETVQEVFLALSRSVLFEKKNKSRNGERGTGNGGTGERGNGKRETGLWAFLRIQHDEQRKRKGNNLGKCEEVLPFANGSLYRPDHVPITFF